MIYIRLHKHKVKPVSLCAQLNKSLCKGCDVVRALVRGNPQSTGCYMKDLCRLLVKLVKSPLAAPQASQVLVELGAAVFPEKALGK